MGKCNDEIKIYRSDLHICFSYELDACTGADPEEGGITKTGSGCECIFFNIACLFM